MTSDFFTKEFGQILGVPQFYLETIAADLNLWRPCLEGHTTPGMRFCWLTTPPPLVGLCTSNDQQQLQTLFLCTLVTNCYVFFI